MWGFCRRGSSVAVGLDAEDGVNVMAASQGDVVHIRALRG